MPPVVYRLFMETLKLSFYRYYYSLSVESLFTNVSVDEIIEHILNRVYRCEDTLTMNIHEGAICQFLHECRKIPCPTQHYWYIVDTFVVLSSVTPSHTRPRGKPTEETEKSTQLFKTKNFSNPLIEHPISVSINNWQ